MPDTDEWGFNREQLREQHELTQEIGNAITSMPLGDPVDEDELEQDLANLEQEKLDEQMLNTGRVPQGDRIDGLGEGMPSLIAELSGFDSEAAAGEVIHLFIIVIILTSKSFLI